MARAWVDSACLDVYIDGLLEAGHISAVARHSPESALRWTWLEFHARQWILGCIGDHGRLKLRGGWRDPVWRVFLDSPVLGAPPISLSPFTKRAMDPVLLYRRDLERGHKTFKKAFELQQHKMKSAPEDRSNIPRLST